MSTVVEIFHRYERIGIVTRLPMSPYQRVGTVTRHQRHWYKIGKSIAIPYVVGAVVDVHKSAEGIATSDG